MRPGKGPDRFMPHGHGPGARPFERGGIKFAIMGLLRDKPRHGYDIILAMEEHSLGLYTPSAGAIYPILQALQDQGLLTSMTEGDRRIYSVTEAGLTFLDENEDEARRHEERWMSHLGLGENREGWKVIGDVNEILGRLQRTAHEAAGDPAKLEEIRNVLQETAERVQAIAGRVPR